MASFQMQGHPWPVEQLTEEYRYMAHSTKTDLDHILFDTITIVFGEMLKEKAIETIRGGWSEKDEEAYCRELIQVKAYIEALPCCGWVTPF